MTSSDGYTPEDPEERIDRLAEKLSLDETQKEALLAAQVLRDEFDTALQTILTVEQYEALLALRPDKCKG